MTSYNSDRIEKAASVKFIINFEKEEHIACYNPEKVISLKFKLNGQQRFTRTKILDFYYLPENIKKIIENFSRNRNMIIDSKKIDSKGFQHNVHSTQELKPKTASVFAR